MKASRMPIFICVSMYFIGASNAFAFAGWWKIPSVAAMAAAVMFAAANVCRGDD